MKPIVKSAIELFAGLGDLTLEDKIQAINDIKIALHEKSPFINEPVDCVVWVASDSVIANEYNPNKVAPPEMLLLKRSISEDGYTQPIVSWSRDDIYEVIDGFHRNRVGRECDDIKERIHGHLPVVVINEGRAGKGNRIASTIRHNRARGKHTIDGMTDIVVQLKKRNWSDRKIGKELGMDQDEVLRLCQISGLTELFMDREFSEAWEAETLDEYEFGITIDDELSAVEDNGTDLSSL